MRNLLTIFKRELGAYFNSSIAYIFVIVFILFNNGLFMMQFFQIGKADMRTFFNALPFALTIFIPAISMRLWAEDKKEYTYELLLTMPIRPHELVLGKYLASFAFYLFTLATTLTVPLMIGSLGKFDPGPVIGGYVGSILIGAVFLAIGIFISGLCKDQIVAFILSMISTFGIYFIGTEFIAAVMDGWLPGVGTFVKNYLGMASHLVGFGRGIIDVKDVVYFILVIFVFLFLNGLSLEGRYRPKAKTFFSLAVAICFVAIILTNWLIDGLPMGRFDVTQDKTHTISDVSSRILRDLKVPVQVKLYISPVDHMPTVLKTMERDVLDKLEEMRIASENKLRYKVIHLESVTPDQDKTLKDALQQQGIMPFQVESIQKDEVGVKLIYSSMTIEYKEKAVEIIPRVVPQTLFDLEYQLMSRIFKMTLEERPKIALFAPVREEKIAAEIDPLVQAQGEKDEKEFVDEYKTAAQLMRNNGYTVNRIALTKDSAIPEKTKALLVLNSGTLTERQRYEINKFLYQGGSAFIGAHGFEYDFKREEKGVEAEPKKQSLDINKLIEKWGVKVNSDILMDDHSQIISLTTGQRVGPFAIEMPIKFPNQIIIDENNINRSAPITNRIPAIFYMWGSALDIAEDVLRQSGLKSTVLFISSPKSWKMANDGSTRLTAENTKIPESVTGKFPLGTILEGQFPNLFNASKAPAWKEGDPEEEVKIGDPKPGKAIVVGSAKIFSEDLLQGGGNLNFFANVVDGLTLGEDLIKIRSKTGVVRDIRRLTNAEKIWYRFLVVLLIPFVLLFVALVRLFLRKKEKEFYLAAQQRG